MNPKTAKAVLKIAVAGISMIAYGAIHRADKKINDKIDDHYANPESEKTEQDD